MAQLLFYVEVVAHDADGRIVDVHNTQSGGLPILYKNLKKAENFASKLRKRYLVLGYESVHQNELPPYYLTSMSGYYNVSICIREVYVQT